MEENEVNNAVFNAAGNGEPKKKSALPVIIAIVLIAAICCCAYVAMGAKSPEKFFESVATKALSGVKESTGDANYAFTFDFDVTEPEGQETPIVKVLNELTGKITTEVGEDKFQVGFYVDRSGKLVGDIDVIATAEDNKAYVKLAPIVEQYVEYEYDEEETNVKEVIEAAKKSGEEIPEARLKILNQELANIISDEKASKEKATIEVNGKNVNTVAYSYTVTVKEAREMIKTFAENLLANEDYLATYTDEKEKKEIVDTLTNLKEEYGNDEDVTNLNDTIKCTVYTAGLAGKKIVRVSSEITPEKVSEDNPATSFVVDVISDKDFTYEALSGETNVKGTITIDEESDKKTNITVTAESEGYTVKAMVGVEKLDGADIPDVSTLDTVKTEDLNSWTLLLNLMNSEAYKIYSEVFPQGMDSSDDDYTSVEATPYGEEDNLDFETSSDMSDSQVEEN